MSTPTLFHYFFVPILYIFVGWLITKCKDIGLIGYRTPRSMKNQENWDFSQKLSGKLLLILGSLAFAINLLFYFAVLPQTYYTSTEVFFILGGTILVIFYTELRLYQFEKKQTTLNHK
ncbi:SdpI family protein [Myroides odoratus]|uniref:SdpI family protein n=2 Tax=Myroides odoratus TaxID=256 RepID=A0A9Q6Z7L8_MYROD|nr:SdpI family protein [Myroides odoratus]EHQ41932.1 hypothetical protein Myrod_1099 [Myroides odoratus DSM 2801]EKB09241.1 hypothetical protein HMPREF9716_00346 [Myroides odoratus CIP 103059]QQT99322.1 SdpI family protein [Myroides odoratus]STZ29193.1 Predicted integral membrane protein [Myroides odoratus]